MFHVKHARMWIEFHAFVKNVLTGIIQQSQSVRAISTNLH